jgi:hypothetical protein
MDQRSFAWRPSRSASIVRSVATIALLFGLPGLIFAAEQSGGKMVWWGMDWIQKQPTLRQTNGVIAIGDDELDDVVAVAARNLQVLALRQDGSVLILGRVVSDASQPPSDLTNGVSVAVEGNSYWFIRANGRIAQWGNDHDKSGFVDGLTDVKGITWVGYRSYLALKKDGTLSGLRFDLHEALMDPISGQPLTPSQIVNLPVKVNWQVLRRVKALTYLYQTPVGLDEDGTVFTLESGGMVGARALAGAPFQYNSKQAVEIQGVPLRDIATMAGSGRHLLAVKSNGTVIAWGDNHYGQCDVPVGLSNVTAVTATEHRSLALRNDGTVVAWGANFRGEGSVPVGLSNVISIAAGHTYTLAVTTGAIPASVYVRPKGRLDELEREADIIFKGQVISSTPVTNASFPHWGKPHATQFRVISMLKGEVGTNSPILWHNTSGPMAWSGGSPPSWHQFELGQCFLVFGVNLDKPAYLYAPPPNTTNRTGEYRQTFRDGVIRTLDDQPIAKLPVKEAHWLELNRLLADANPSNSLYAIKHLDGMSKACGPHDDWPRTGDFKRSDILRVIRPLLAHTNEAVSIAAIGCYRVGFPCATQLVTHADALIAIASQGPTIARRVAAIAAFMDSRLNVVRDSLPLWLDDASEEVRAQAIALVPDFPGEFAEAALRKSATDVSARVRAVTADAIGKGQLTNLLGTLAELFQDPIGREQPLPPLTLENLEGGGRAGVCCDVHTSAGYALLKFEVTQIADILKTNLNDAGFRLQFLCKLAEIDVKPWLDDLTEIMEARRERSLKKAAANGAPPNTYMYLSGAYNRCWKIVYEHLKGLPFARFERGRADRYLRMLEQAGTTGSQEPLMIYELYKMKGLNKRAAKYRSEIESAFAWASINQFFDKIDAKYPRNGMIPDQ